jgi:2-amino-4-hydroxy-6-hydroxymethyldihydropteridine diphosphokinase
MSLMAYIGYGSNLGDRHGTYEKAVKALAEVNGIVVVKASRLYETDPVGLVDGGAEFLNGVVAIETDLDPAELMAALRRIELKLGKSPEHRSDLSRPVDLDLLLYGDQTVKQEGIVVPHPRMHTRGFVLAPLVEIAPEAVHPTFNRSISALAKELAGEEMAGVRPWQATPT